MDNCDNFHSHVTKKEYKINFAFNCDSSNVVCLIHFTVLCGFQCVGSTTTPFRYSSNICKAYYRNITAESSVPQMDLFRHFSEENHHGFLEDIRVKIKDSLVEGRWGRIRESFWKYKVNTFTPRGFNVRQV